MKLTLQTIDFASRLGAGLVVLHLGRVHMGPATKQLGVLAQQGKQNTKEWIKLNIDAVREREKKAQVYRQRVL